MKNKKMMLLLLPLCSVLAFTCTSCNKESNSRFEEYYDEDWKPGQNALKDAKQPTVKNPKGKTSILNEIRRSQNKIGLPSMGDANLLVVPINFSGDDQVQELNPNLDLVFTDDDVNALNDLYFAKSAPFGAPASVREYYTKSSYGKLNLNGVVSPVVTLPKTFTDYLFQSAVSTSFKDVYLEIVEYIYNYLFVETKTYYIGDFDADNDEKVDGISIICNYPYSLTFGEETLDSIIQLFLGPGNVGFSNDILDTNKTPVNSFSFISEEFSDILFAGSDSNIYINQVGRMLGLDDYSDLTGDSVTGSVRAPLGLLDMMDGYIGDHNPFSKYQLGWTTPKTIKAEDIPSEGLTIKLRPSATYGDSLVLYTGKHNMFSEYLILDFYTPTGLNEINSKSPYLFGNQLFETSGIRVYQVDSRLVRGYGNTNYSIYDKTPDFDEKVTLPSGKKVYYTYDYAYTNNYENEYANYGITQNTPLVSFLSKVGLNRHITDYSYGLIDDDIFAENDEFGADNQIDGFYKNFKFHGDGNNGARLNIKFKVSSVNEDEATIVLWRAE